MRYTLYTLSFLLLVALLPLTARAQEPIRLHWQQYDTIVTINPDGSMDVQEQQRLIVDQGRLSRMTRNFTTGDKGRVTNIQVLEDGQPYSPGNNSPGTYSGSDTGDEARIQLWFRNPDADEHTFIIVYTVHDALVARNDRVTLDWSFFWRDPNAPEIRNGSVEIRFPQQVNPSELSVDASGVPVQRVSESNPLRWELTSPIQGDELRVQTTFPRAVLAADAGFQGAQGNPNPRTNQPVVPAPNTTPVPAAGGGTFDFMFCLMVLIFLFIAFTVIRASARNRNVRGYPPVYRPTRAFGPPSFPGPRTRRSRRRRYGGWGGGFFPPIIITPPSQPRDHAPGSPLDSGPFGDSGGSGSSWGDSGGSGSSWGDSGGSGSSWGDMGGGGSSWGGGGDSSGGDRGGSGGGSFG